MIRSKYILLFAFLLCSLGIKSQVVASAGFETDARTLGFGGAGVALDANALSLYRNTAAISFDESERKMTAAYSYTPIFNDAKLHTVGGYYRLNEDHAFTAGVRYYAGAKIENTEDGLTYETIKPYDVLIDLGYARKVADILSLSANIRYVYSKINEAPGIKNGKSFALDLGVHLRQEAFSAALSVSNLGKLIDYGTDEYRMPGNVKTGAAYRYSIAKDHKLTGSIEGRYNFMPANYTFFSGGAGAEYMFRDLIAVRGGYHLASENSSTGDYGSVGCGVYCGPVVIDFAYLLTTDKKSVMNDMWCLTAGVRF